MQLIKLQNPFGVLLFTKKNKKSRDNGLLFSINDKSKQTHLSPRYVSIPADKASLIVVDRRQISTSCPFTNNQANQKKKQTKGCTHHTKKKRKTYYFKLPHVKPVDFFLSWVITIVSSTTTPPRCMALGVRLQVGPSQYRLTTTKFVVKAKLT